MRVARFEKMACFAKQNISMLGKMRMTDSAPVRRLPLTVQTTYADLLARLQQDAVLELGGTPVLRKRRGRQYWYSVQRLAGHTVERYLGPDTGEVRGRVEQAMQVRDDLSRRERQRGRLVRMCREGGLLRVDAQTGKVLRALARAGVFRLRGVIVGTHAFRCYPGLLGVEMPEALAVTEDIDSAAFRSIAIALDDRLDPALAEVLKRIGPFVARPGYHRQPTAWRDRQSGALVELLTPDQGPDRDEPVELPTLGAHAVPLRFLDSLIHRPVQAAALYRSGVLVNVPPPARYAVHKLIVATRRSSSATAKAAKDVEQSAALFRVLAEDRPDELEDAFAEARERGSSWRTAVEGYAATAPGCQGGARKHGR